jgi:hypothetical protein
MFLTHALILQFVISYFDIFLEYSIAYFVMVTAKYSLVKGCLVKGSLVKGCTLQILLVNVAYVFFTG